MHTRAHSADHLHAHAVRAFDVQSGLHRVNIFVLEPNIRNTEPRLKASPVAQEDIQCKNSNSSNNNKSSVAVAR